MKKKVEIITVGNRKGGVGKTTLVLHLAFAAAAAGKRVLVMDNDSQCDVSQFLLNDSDVKYDMTGGIADFIRHQVITPRQTIREGIDLLAANEELDGLDGSADFMLEKGLVRGQLQDLPYDLIIIDTPPSLGVRHVAPFIWADLAILPMKPDSSSVDRFMDTIKVIDSIRSMNPGLKWFGVFNQYDRDSISQTKIIEAAKGRYGKQIAQVFRLRNTVCDAIQLADGTRPVWEYGRANKLVREEWKKQCTALLAL